MSDELALMWEVVRAVAEMRPYSYNDMSGKMECVFCGNVYNAGDEEGKKKHAPHCTYLKATAIAEKTASKE